MSMYDDTPPTPAEIANYNWERSPEYLVAQIRQLLTRYENIRVDCYNADEANKAMALLHPDELLRVVWTY